jgi:hypothetical protein
MSKELKSKSLSRPIPANPKSKDTPSITSQAKTRPTAILPYIYDLSEKLEDFQQRIGQHDP